jgi:predicted alpha/beta superfamily hydrolase
MKNLALVFCAITLYFSCNSKVEPTTKDTSKIIVSSLKKTVLARGQLIRVARFPSENITARPVDVWLPGTYSPEKKYAVVYMHDGQNLFDSTTTWNQQEWKIDEIATKLMNKKITKDFIVVGIHNIPNLRWQDLFPQKVLAYLEDKERETFLLDAKESNLSLKFKGDAYLKFLVEEVKPYIDSAYATYPNKENTFVAGSSMGGLMSMYAVAEYPAIFEGAACLSTHWIGGTVKVGNPLPEAIFKYLEAKIPSSKNHKMYFDYGSETLDQFYTQYAPRVNAIFKKNGYSDENFKNLFFEGADHSELSWQKRVEIPLTFLLKK